ncbi:MAG: NAD(+)/NADH kinase [Gemmatimonadales bacterium]
MILGVVGNPRYAEVPALLSRLRAAAPGLGIEVRLESDLAAFWPEVVPTPFEGPPPDVVLAIGGDGTLLRSARFIGRREVPLVGVHVGRLGFLSSVTPGEFDQALQLLALGEYTTEQRQMLEAEVESADAVRSVGMALNDAVVHKAGVARVVRLGILADGETVGAFSSDGIIIATPTGSTAYSLSAGGPIVVPGVDALVITPICPHTLGVRPIVVHGKAEIQVTLLPPIGEEDVLLSLDGQIGTPIMEGDRIRVRRANHLLKLVRFHEDGFFATLRRKLQWGDPSGRDR